MSQIFTNPSDLSIEENYQNSEQNEQTFNSNNSSNSSASNSQSSLSTQASSSIQNDKKTLEQKLSRLQEIQQILSQKTVSLSQSMPLLEEAYTLKREIEEELKTMQTQLINLTKNDNEND